jgi:hypothetical protein
MSQRQVQVGKRDTTLEAPGVGYFPTSLIRRWFALSQMRVRSSRWLDCRVLGFVGMNEKANVRKEVVFLCTLNVFSFPASFCKTKTTVRYRALPSFFRIF